MRIIFFFLFNILFSNSIQIINSSFENNSIGWNNISIDSSEYFSPLDQKKYARLETGSDYTYQITDHIIQNSTNYTLSFWARSINQSGDNSETILEIEIFSGSGSFSSSSIYLNVTELLGAPQYYPNDDGANIWLDNGYRMQFADHIFYQDQSSDPIFDEWEHLFDEDYDHDMAIGQIITPQGFKGLYNTYYEDFGPNPYSEIWILEALGNPPNYNWSSNIPILSHEGDEDPWVIDAHLFYDDESERLWMSWGGGTCWVSELNPSTGRLINNPSNTEFDTHPEGTHFEVAKWNGDEWSSEWFEGPALFKRNNYWYFFASYGNLSLDYTIRMGRGESPIGPFFDKNGTNLAEFNEFENEYGNSILFGDEGRQLVPGHPHVWEENNQYYIGYDYRTNTNQGLDIMGIRNLYFYDEWPTIWKPYSITFNSNEFPHMIGENLGLRFKNSGFSSSIVAIDNISIDYFSQLIIGDINQDSYVNIQDIILVINLILNSLYEITADLNSDTNIDILDIIQLVNIILDS